MASRRVRIKGIANIPQRKRANATDGGDEPAGKLPENAPDRCEGEPNLSPDRGSHGAGEVRGEVDSERGSLAASNENVTQGNELRTIGEEVKADGFGTVPPEPDVSGEGTVKSSNGTGKETKALPSRRKFIKPQVAVNSINRKKGKADDATVEPDKENVQEVVNVNLNETVIAPNLSPVKNDQPPGPLSVKISPAPIPQKDTSKCGSDTEYPLPPASPSKLLNRRIKAVPRLHRRRTSFSIGSASESETEDSRRSTHSRVRNDSVCSVASVATDTQASVKGAASPTRKDAAGPSPARKFRRSEQGRRIAEARRSFYQKFADGKPDKQKLTMIDLIYYNPATNPMNPRKRRETTASVPEEAPASPKPAIVAEEAAPAVPANSGDDDDDEDAGGVPAPQIKVGPNGEIVIDERSLVIENVETQRSRRALEAAEAVDGDLDARYGVFKRAKRAKDWSDGETLRFYKALNTIGTDFAMMCELFPARTRRELKLKFKREEKVNRALVDRAVMRPVEFDMDQLRKDLEEHERFVEEKRRRAEETKLAKERERQRRLGRRHEKKGGLPGIDAADVEECDRPAVKRDRQPKRKRRKKHPYDNLKKGIDSLLEDTDDSDEEYRPANAEGKAEAKRPTILRAAKKVPVKADEGNENLEPGSLMIVPTSDSGKTSYKVFMITEENSKREAVTDVSDTPQQNAGKIVNVQNIITISENSIEDPETPGIEITKDSIIFPFDECPLSAGNNPNITISHDDNKMTIVTES